MGRHEKMTGAERVAARRERLRAQGLRPRQFWLADLRDPMLKAQIRAEALALAAQQERWLDEIAFVYSVADEQLAALPPHDIDDGSKGDKARPTP